MKMCDMTKLQLFTKFNSNERKFTDTPHGRKQNSQTNHGDRNCMIQRTAHSCLVRVVIFKHLGWKQKSFYIIIHVHIGALQGFILTAVESENTNRH